MLLLFFLHSPCEYFHLAQNTSTKLFKETDFPHISLIAAIIILKKQNKTNQLIILCSCVSSRYAAVFKLELEVGRAVQ
jgi:hypothetical protein